MFKHTSNSVRQIKSLYNLVLSSVTGINAIAVEGQRSKCMEEMDTLQERGHFWRRVKGM